MYPDRTVLVRPERPVKPAQTESRSKAAVDDGLIRHRISLLAFDEPEVLVQAAHDLILNGFTASQFCMFGQPSDILDAVNVQKGRDGLERALADLWAEPQRRIKLAGTEPVAMRCGQRAAGLFETVDPHIKTPEWIRPDLSRSITTSIEQGRTILLVASGTAKQHALGARLLLRHGKHDLQTHEFSVRLPS
ncbi:MAG: hypothetical protein ABL901_11825 [Hyphomicrobiaceae bacterium]